MAVVLRWVLCILVMLQIVALTACSEPEPEPEIVKQSVTPEPLKVPALVTAGAREWATRFKSVAKPVTGNKVARLQFDVQCAGEAVGTMELIDAASPVGTKLNAGFCGARITPRVNAPRIASERDRQCDVAGYYDLLLYDGRDELIGQFRITEIGMLELKSDSVTPDFDVELLTTVARTLFVVYPHRTAGQDPPPLMAMEYNHHECKTARDLTAADGWKYTFQFADGVLRVLPPSCLTGWPEYLRAKAAEEVLGRRETFEEKSKRLEREKKEREACGSGG